MPPDEPAWWYASEPHVAAMLLRPVAKLYWRIVERRRQTSTAWRSDLPVICVGNFTAGGTGKTPLTALLARLLVARGQRPAILTRGYGGGGRGPLWVEPGRHTARDVGDEALLLARSAPTLVGRDRALGARAIEAAAWAPTVIVMDDGLQNTALAKDLVLAVVDARRGIGNGEMIPAGPLRGPLDLQLGRVDAVVVNQPPGFDPRSESGATAWLKQRFHGPVMVAGAVAAGETGWLAGQRVVAFAGIANPDRFFALVRSLGAEIVERARFPDHHRFSDGDAARLLAIAERHSAQLVTTEKDLVRLAGSAGPCRELEQRSRAVGIELRFDDRDLERLGVLLEMGSRRRPGTA